MGTAGGLGTVNPGGQPGATGGTFTERIRNIVNRASSPTASGDITVIGETKIIADERTNSLLVYATRQDMETIKDVISKLDVVLAQVLIESIILGVSGDSSLEYGVSAAQKPKAYNDTLTGAGIMNNDKGALVDGLTSLFSTNAAASLGGLNYFGKINDEWLVAVKALSSSGKAEVLQRPVIMTTHATEGQFFVGNTVPYVTSSYYGGSSLYGPSSSYQQLRVGIELTVTPFINPDGIVVMKIDQRIEEIDGSTRIEGVGDVPNTASRTLLSGRHREGSRDHCARRIHPHLQFQDQGRRAVAEGHPGLWRAFPQHQQRQGSSRASGADAPHVLKTPELAAMGSNIERERMTGIHKFEKKLDKENAEFDREMDLLDGVRPGETPEGTNSALDPNPRSSWTRSMQHPCPMRQMESLRPRRQPCNRSRHRHQPLHLHLHQRQRPCNRS